MGIVAVAAALAVMVAACGSSSTPEITGAPRVVGNGKQYSYSAGRVPQSHWPATCSLLPRSSAEAALGTSIHTRHFHGRCYFLPFSASYPTLTIDLKAVGSGLGGRYQRVEATHHGKDRHSVAGVGRGAYLHSVRHLPATALEVLARYAYFTVTVQSPVGQKLSAARTRALLVVVGRVIAKEFG